MSKTAIAVISLYGLVAWFGLHGAACAMHTVAAEQYWARGGNKNTYKWSHAYCKLMSAPLRFMLDKM